MTHVSRLTSGSRAGTLALAGALLGALLAISAWVAPTVLAADEAVDISGFAFNPGSVTVQVGDSVTWRNAETDVNHTATSDDGVPAAFDSSTIVPAETFAFAFTEAGTYTYHCSIHPNMTGTVVVEAAAAATPTPVASQLPDGATPAGSGPAAVQTWSLAVGLLLMSLGALSLVLLRRRQRGA